MNERTKLIGRRRLLTAGAAAGLLAASGMPLRAAPKAGGTLRLGVSGALATDSWDSRTHQSPFMKLAAHGAVFDTLTQIAANGELVGELAESWEASSDAKRWRFKLRHGVTFHSGKKLTPEDVIGSLALHLDTNVASPAYQIVASIDEMRVFGRDAVEIQLVAPNADFPILLADHHLCIYPAEQAELAMITGNGTGLYRVAEFVPGQIARLKRLDHHYKDGREGWFSEVELHAYDALSARNKLLLEGQLDAIDGVDFVSVGHLQSQNHLRVSEIAGHQHLAFKLPTKAASSRDALAVKAIKHLIDRDTIVRGALLGHGRVGRDLPIGPSHQYFASSVPVPEFDPALAKALWKDAGVDRAHFYLQVVDQGAPGLSAAASMIRKTAAEVGIHLNLKPTSNRTISANTRSGHLTEDWTLSNSLSEGFLPQLEKTELRQLAEAARSELNTSRRRSLYAELQHRLAEDSTVIVPAFANTIDVYSNKLAHGAVGQTHGLDNSRMIERWWFA